MHRRAKALLVIGLMLILSGCEPPKPTPKTEMPWPELHAKPQRLRPKPEAPMYRIERNRFGPRLRRVNGPIAVVEREQNNGQ